jgi:NarL family two-component system response regulator LiaR
MKILIADDKLHFRRGLRRLIEEHDDWSVCAEAEDGVQAVNQAKKFKPDLIVLDLAMPELNGFEAAAQISKALPCVPILMFTLYVSPLVEKKAEKVGVQRVISKSTGYMLVPAIEEAFAQGHREKAA